MKKVIKFSAIALILCVLTLIPSLLAHLMTVAFAAGYYGWSSGSRGTLLVEFVLIIAMVAVYTTTAVTGLRTRSTHAYARTLLFSVATALFTLVVIILGNGGLFPWIAFIASIVMAIASYRLDRESRTAGR